MATPAPVPDASDQPQQASSVGKHSGLEKRSGSAAAASQMRMSVWHHRLSVAETLTHAPHPLVTTRDDMVDQRVRMDNLRSVISCPLHCTSPMIDASRLARIGGQPALCHAFNLSAVRAILSAGIDFLIRVVSILTPRNTTSVPTSHFANGNFRNLPTLWMSLSAHPAAAQSGRPCSFGGTMM